MPGLTWELVDMGYPKWRSASEPSSPLNQKRTCLGLAQGTETIEDLWTLVKQFQRKVNQLMDASGTDCRYDTPEKESLWRFCEDKVDTEIVTEQSELEDSIRERTDALVEDRVDEYVSKGSLELREDLKHKLIDYVKDELFDDVVEKVVGEVRDRVVTAFGATDRLTQRRRRSPQDSTSEGQYGSANIYSLKCCHSSGSLI